MNSYKVTWEIELDAPTSEDAAREALKIQRDPKNTVLVFRMEGASMVGHRLVDLWEEEFGRMRFE